MNLWIVKPGGLSRGRNIRIFRDYHKILEYAEVDADKQLSAATMGQSASKLNTRAHYLAHQNAKNDDDFSFTRRVWVIQKYIENPMIIMNRKFDIRVWVIGIILGSEINYAFNSYCSGLEYPANGNCNTGWFDYSEESQSWQYDSSMAMKCMAYHFE